MFDSINETIEALAKLIPSREKEDVANLDDIFEQIKLLSQHKLKYIYETGWKRLDEKLHITPSILLLAGSGGTGKTSFITAMMKKLLSRHNDIAICWVIIDHESARSTMNKFLQMDLHLTLEELMGIGRKMNEMDINAIMALKESYKEYDIVYHRGNRDISDIRKKFRLFCLERKEKFNILIIDNVMQLEDHFNGKIKGNQTTIDDFITHEIASIYKENSSSNCLIIPIHHLTKEKQKQSLDEAYEPKREHIKGSSRWDDVPEKILLINSPGIYPDLVRNYPGHEEILQHLFIVNFAKNTFGKMGYDYFWVYPEYNIYEEIEEINNKL